MNSSLQRDRVVLIVGLDPSNLGVQVVGRGLDI